MAYKTSHYVTYNSKNEVAGLDLNSPSTNKAISFPGRIYAGEPFPVNNYICQQGMPRDTRTDYIIGLDRLQHPATFSRFGHYTGCDNEYCSGSYSRGYNAPPQCFNEPDPVDCAPARFYENEFHNPFINGSQAQIDAFKARNMPRIS